MGWLVPAAFTLDLLLGDPRRLPHPIVMIGACIKRLEELLRERFADLRLAGIVLAVMTLTATGVVASVFLYLRRKSIPCSAGSPPCGWPSPPWPCAPCTGRAVSW
jgi:adenosylcobinamide-phosphate synthase